MVAVFILKFGLRVNLVFLVQLLYCCIPFKTILYEFLLNIDSAKYHLLENN